MHFFSLFFREKVRFRAKIFHIGSGCIEGIFHKLCKRCSNVMMLINLYIFPLCTSLKKVVT